MWRERRNHRTGRHLKAVSVSYADGSTRRIHPGGPGGLPREAETAWASENSKSWREKAHIRDNSDKMIGLKKKKTPCATIYITKGKRRLELPDSQEDFGKLTYPAL